MQLFFSDLRRVPDGRPSLMLQYAEDSGYARRFGMSFDPFQYEADARAAACRLPYEATVLAELSPARRCAVRFFALEDTVTGPTALLGRGGLRRLDARHPGFGGIREEAAAEEYRRDERARRLFEKALTLAAATALYRGMDGRPGGLYFTAEGWDSAYRLRAGYGRAAG